MESGELALICACSLSLSKLILYELGEELLRLDEGNLNVTMRISLEEELLLNSDRKKIEYCECRSRKT